MEPVWLLLARELQLGLAQACWSLKAPEYLLEYFEALVWVYWQQELAIDLVLESCKNLLVQFRAENTQYTLRWFFSLYRHLFRFLRYIEQLLLL